MNCSPLKRNSWLQLRQCPWGNLSLFMPPAEIGFAGWFAIRSPSCSLACLQRPAPWQLLPGGSAQSWHQPVGRSQSWAHTHAMPTAWCSFSCPCKPLQIVSHRQTLSLSLSNTCHVLFGFSLITSCVKQSFPSPMQQVGTPSPAQPILSTTTLAMGHLLGECVLGKDPATRQP